MFKILLSFYTNRKTKSKLIEMPLRIRYASIKAQHSAISFGNHTFDRKRSVQRSVTFDCASNNNNRTVADVRDRQRRLYRRPYFHSTFDMLRQKHSAALFLLHVGLRHRYLSHPKKTSMLVQSKAAE